MREPCRISSDPSRATTAVPTAVQGIQVSPCLPVSNTSIVLILTVIFSLLGWASWNVSFQLFLFLYLCLIELSIQTILILMEMGLVGSLPLHAVRSTAPEAGDAHLQGQVLEHGQLVFGAG